jgi:hypothetical protein
LIIKCKLAEILEIEIFEIFENAEPSINWTWRGIVIDLREEDLHPPSKFPLLSLSSGTQIDMNFWSKLYLSLTALSLKSILATLNDTWHVQLFAWITIPDDTTLMGQFHLVWLIKRCYINHLLWNHGSSCTFLRGTLADSFFPARTINAVHMIGIIAMVGFDRLCARRKPIGEPIGASGLVSDILGWYVHGHVHVPADQVNFCACTCAHMHKTDLPTDPNKRHARCFMDIISSTLFHRHRGDAIPRRNPFYCCTSPQIPLHTAQKIEVVCIIPQHRLLYAIIYHISLENEKMVLSAEKKDIVDRG